MGEIYDRVSIDDDEPHDAAWWALGEIDGIVDVLESWECAGEK